MFWFINHAFVLPDNLVSFMYIKNQQTKTLNLRPASLDYDLYPKPASLDYDLYPKPASLDYDFYLKPASLDFHRSPLLVQRPQTQI